MAQTENSQRALRTILGGRGCSVSREIWVGLLRQGAKCTKLRTTPEKHRTQDAFCRRVSSEYCRQSRPSDGRHCAAMGCWPRLTATHTTTCAFSVTCCVPQSAVSQRLRDDASQATQPATCPDEQSGGPPPRAGAGAHPPLSSSAPPRPSWPQRQPRFDGDAWFASRDLLPARQPRYRTQKPRFPRVPVHRDAHRSCVRTSNTGSLAPAALLSLRQGRRLSR